MPLEMTRPVEGTEGCKKTPTWHFIHSMKSKPCKGASRFFLQVFPKCMITDASAQKISGVPNN